MTEEDEKLMDLRLSWVPDPSSNIMESIRAAFPAWVLLARSEIGHI